MPIATPDQYAEMLDRAKKGGFAYPAINVTSSETVNAAIKGFADAGSDGIIQVSTGGAEFASGTGVKNMVTGAVALAEFAHVVAGSYGVTVALPGHHDDPVIHERREPVDGLLQQGPAGPGQVEQELGCTGPRQRPEAGPGAARRHDGPELVEY